MRTDVPCVDMMRSRKFSACMLVSLLTTLLVASSARAVTIPSTAFRYVHDADGRLVAASDPSSDTAVFAWDPVGNLLGVSRHATSSLKIIQLRQTHGAVGDAITLDGTGFSTTASSNTVEVNGTAATVTSASERSLTFTIPTAATTGTVTVAVASTIATSAQTLTVDASSAPVVTGVSPAIAKPGDTVTVTGSNFDPKIIRNVAKVGHAIADVSSASSTSLQLTVPGGTASGPAAVSTIDGSGSGPDVFIPPGTLTTSDIGPTARLAPGTAHTMTFSTPYKVGLVTLSGKAGQQMTFTVSNNTMAGLGVYLFDPTGTQTLYSQGWGGGSNIVDAVTLPATGTYTLEFAGWASSTGSLDVTGYVSDDIQEPLTPTTSGAVKNADLTVPGQSARYTVAGQAGHAVSVAWDSSTITSGALEWRDPSGNFVGGGTIATGSGFFDQFVFPSTGTYTLVVNPYNTYTGSIALTAYDATDVAGGTFTPTTSGDTKTPTTTVPGQKVRYTFAGTQGDRVSMAWASSTYSTAYVRLYSPSGTEFDGATIGSGSGYRDAIALPATGTYTLVIDPNAQSTGSASLTVYDASDLATTITPSTGGDAKSLSLSTPGRNARLTFSATAGQHVAFSVGSAPDQGAMWLYDPSGNYVTVGIYYSSGGMMDATLPSTGTYTLVVDPIGAATGTTTLTGYLVNDVTGSLSPSTSGATQSPSLTTPGQSARYTVSGVAGQQASVTWQNATFSSWQLYWLTPTGGWLNGTWIGAGSGFLNQITFPTTGTYQLVVDPYGAATGAVDLTAYDATDLTSTVTPSADGDDKSLALNVPGQNAMLSFSGTSGQSLSFAVTGAPGYGTMLLRNSAGSYVGIASYASYGTTLNVTLPSDDTYTLVVDPDGSATGTTYLTAYDNDGARAARAATRMSVLKPHPVGVFAKDALAATSPRLTATLPTPAATATTLKKTPISTREFLRHRPWARHLSTLLRGDIQRAPRAKRLPPWLMPDRHAVGRQRHQPGFSGSSRITPAGMWVPGPGSRKSGKWISDLPKTSTTYAPLSAPARSTGLTGHALRIDGRPLAGVTIGLEGARQRTTTDALGRFLLIGTPGRHTLIVDGRSANSKHARYGTFSIRADLERNQTTDLGYPLWMTQLDHAGDKRIASPTRDAQVLTTPRIPGLEVRLPKGTVIRDAGGKLVRDLNLTQVPVDRPPFPLPSFIGVPVYFTVQPGRAYLSKGAQIIYPNYNHQAAGQRVDFWNYDAHDRGWYIYGKGTVSKDAKQVIPDPNVRVWEFTGAMISSAGAPPAAAPKTGAGGPIANPRGPEIIRLILNSFNGSGDNATAGSVDLGTGLFVHQETDLTLADVLPATVARAYRQGDANTYSFGIGTAAPWDMRLWSIHNYGELELVVPDGGTVHFERTSPGMSWADAFYESTNVSGEYQGATVSFNSDGWDLVRRDGTTYVFGDMAGLQAIRDRYGNTLRFTHVSGQSGNTTQVTTPNGRWIKLTYDSSNRVTQAKDNAGRTVTYAYDTSGRLTTVTDPEGRTTEYTYNSASQMTAIKNGRNITTVQNTYDSNGRLATQTLPGGATSTFAYTLSSSGAVTHTTTTNPRGYQRKTTFNTDGYAVEETAALGTSHEQTWTTSRQAGTGRVNSTIDPLGRQTTYSYDSHGNITAATILAGTSQAQTTSSTYDSHSLLTSLTDPANHTTTLTRGTHGEVTSVTDALGHSATATYRSDGQLASSTTPMGKTTTLSYSLGFPTASTDALGRKTSIFTDAAGRNSAVDSPEGRHSTVEYNDDNEQTKTTDADGNETTVAYDGAGNATSVTDPNGHATSLTYDSRDRVTANADPATATASAAYDDNGNLTQKTDRKGQVTKYTYDELDRLTEVRYGVVGTTAESTVSYTYDAGDRVTQAVDSDSGTYTQTYDDMDRMTSAVTPQGTIGYGYDTDGRRTSMTMAGVAQTDYAYDDADRLTSMTRGSQSASFAYNNDDELTDVTLPDGIVGTRAYDDAGQLSSITYTKGAATVGDLDYAYDNDGAQIAEWGSLATLTLPPALSSATYDNANEQTARGETTLTYDANGALTNDGTKSYSYNARGRLVSMSGSGTTASFTYDLLGRRIGKTINGTTTNFAYDGDDAVKETTGSATATMLNAPGVDNHLSRTTAGGTENYLVDRLGSTLALADSAGAIATSYAYTPFGKPTTTGTTSTNPYQFTGRETDSTGLQYSRARYYNPDAGRFISRDPAGSSGSGNNLYAYVGNDPVDATDPTGLWPDPPDPWAKLATVIAGAVDNATGGWVGDVDDLPESMRTDYLLGQTIGQLASEFTAPVKLAGGAIHTLKYNTFDNQLDTAVGAGGQVSERMKRLGEWLDWLRLGKRWYDHLRPRETASPPIPPSPKPRDPPTPPARPSPPGDATTNCAVYYRPWCTGSHPPGME